MKSMIRRAMAVGLCVAALSASAQSCVTYAAESRASMGTVMLRLSDLGPGYVDLMPGGRYNTNSAILVPGPLPARARQVRLHGFLQSYVNFFRTTRWVMINSVRVPSIQVDEEGDVFRSVAGAQWAFAEARTTVGRAHPLTIVRVGDQSFGYVTGQMGSGRKGVGIIFRRGSYLLSITVWRTPLAAQQLARYARIVDMRLRQAG